MAKDPLLEKIERQFEPESGEGTTGFISAQDLKDAFEITFTALDEVELVARGDTFNWAMLNASTGGKGASLLETLFNNRNVLALLEAMARANGIPNPKKGVALDVPMVTGDPNPTTVAQVGAVLNSLIEALAAAGLVVDQRAPVATDIVGPTDASNPFYDATNNPNNKQWAFTPAGSAAPANLTDLQNAGITPVPGTAWVDGQDFVDTADGARQSWDGTAWVAWTPVLTHLIEPTGLNALEWGFGPVGQGLAPPQVLANLQGLGAGVGTAPVDQDGNTVGAFTAGQFVTLGDNTHAFWDGTQWLAGQA